MTALQAISTPCETQPEAQHMQKNASGVRPQMYKVVVQLPEVEEKTGAGLLLPSEFRNKQQLEGDTGVIIAVGQSAFTNREEFPHSPPRVGDKVFFQRWSGMLIERNGVRFRLMEDRDVAGVYFDD